MNSSDQLHKISDSIYKNIDLPIENQTDMLEKSSKKKRGVKYIDNKPY